MAKILIRGNFNSGLIRDIRRLDKDLSLIVLETFGEDFQFKIVHFYSSNLSKDYIGKMVDINMSEIGKPVKMIRQEIKGYDFKHLLKVDINIIKKINSKYCLKSMKI